MSDNRTTERIRLDDRDLADRDWSPNTEKEIPRELVRKMRALSDKHDAARRRSTWTMIGTVITLLGGVIAVITPVSSCGRKVIVAELSDDFAARKDMRRVEHKLDWLIERMVPGSSPPSFEERENKEPVR